MDFILDSTHDEALYLLVDQDEALSLSQLHTEQYAGRMHYSLFIHLRSPIAMLVGKLKYLTQCFVHRILCCMAITQ